MSASKRPTPAAAGADDDNGLVTIVFGSGGADSLVLVVTGEGTIRLPMGYTMGVEAETPVSGATRMATVKRKDEGKSMFLKEYLVDHPDAAKEAIDAAWGEAGHEGSISTSLISKVRRDLGGAGKATATVKSRARGRTGNRPSAGSKSAVRAAGPAVEGRIPEKENVPVAGRPERQAEPQPAGGDRTHVLIRLEGAIDDLLHEIKLAGGLPEFEETLRRARRILVRSHGE